MALTPGTRLGAYEIVAPLGAGGMGEVYRARDRKLDRDVAVKVLPQSVAAHPDTLARFEREAKAVAALSHPNILSIFDFEAEAGITYAVMELLEGDTLRAKLDSGPIAQKQAADYALQVARGLSAAHAKGIVHRDLKPENLFVTKDGHLKILDFGLAKRVETLAAETSAPTRAGHTEPGMIMGTAGYMSPEQVKGFPVDHRSDIFSLGTILYELLSGKRAFKRETNAETMAAILRDEPPELSESERNISPALDRIVKHCLEKDRDHRFQSARDIAFNLLEHSSPAVAGSGRETAAPVSGAGFRVAVLPFKYSGGNADLSALAEALAGDIITGLSRFSYLKVIARSATSRFVNEAVNVRTASRELSARYVMEGNLRQAGGKLRLAVQLVDAASGAHLWAENYERAFSPEAVFELQDDLVPRIVSTCGDRFGVLARSISDEVRGGEPGQVGPYEALMRGFGYHQRLTPAEHAEAREALERAVERAPSNADCWAMLSWIYSHEHAHGFNVLPGSLERALAAARRAVDIAPSNQLAQQALAVVLFFRKETAGCLSAAQRAMALNPLDASNEATFLITLTGDWDRGCALIRRAMDLNPHHPRWYGTILGINEYRLANYAAAVDEALRANAADIFWTNVLLAAAHGQLGEVAAAGKALRDLLAQKEDFAQSASQLLGKWFDAPMVEHLVDGLRKAGLGIAPEKGTAVPAPDGGRSAAADSGVVRAEEGFWIAVLPFKYSGANADLSALADGLSEDIVTGLSRFSYLRVIARSSTSRFVNEAGDVRTAGRQLGARYVMEGNLRQAGGKLRLAVQLVDAVSGAHLWAENYERAFSPEAVFELQDDLVPRIVSTVADPYGVLPHSISETLRKKDPDQLSPYEAVLRYFGYIERATPEEHAKARDALERAVENAPDQANCWAMLSMVYKDEHTHGYNVRPDPLGRALAAAHRAAEIAPSNHLPHQALAAALFFRRDIVAFRNAAERTIALNPMDGGTHAYVGHLIAYAGDWERGCALVERARQLNPNHPGWYWFVAFTDAYRKRDYRGALEIALKINMPGNFYASAAIAAAYGQLGEREAARPVLMQLLAMKPGFAASAREEFGKWHGPGQLLEDFLDGLRKAGLEIPPEEESAAAPPPGEIPQSEAKSESGAARAEEGFWIAVLPFKYSGNVTELAALADGLTEDVVTGLSRFSYLRVIARSSTSRYANEAVAVRAAGRELGARYVMEGNLRHAGGKLRLAVQLVDAVSGAHLWAETYERTFRSQSVFELQDDLVPRVVSTVADWYGILPRSMSEVVRSKPVDRLSPYEALLRGFGYYERVTPEEHAVVRPVLERAVEQAPGHAAAWAMLSMLYGEEHRFGFNAEPDSLGRSLRAAQRAAAAAPSSHFSHLALAQAHYFRKEFEAFKNAAERAVALNPRDGATIEYLGHLLAFAGDWERGCDLAERGRDLNPNHPPWYWALPLLDAYRRGDYRGARAFIPKANMPGQYYSLALFAALYGQLGEHEAAAEARRNLLSLKPDFASVARDQFEKWYLPDLVELLIDGLRKAGLDVPAVEGARAEAGSPAGPAAGTDA